MLRTLALLAVFLVGGCGLIDPALLDPRALFEPRTKEPETELDRLVNQFAATAFDGEFGPRRNSFRRIDADIVVRISEPNFAQRDPILATVAELAELIGRPITVLDPKDLRTPASVIVIFNSNGICRVGTKQPHGAIFVQIGAGGCVAEELYQALALDNEACIVESILCGGGAGSYTAADKILLRTAYDTRLKHGMNRKLALPIVREIIAELMVE